MRISGVAGDEEVMQAELGHGADPAVVAYEAGWWLVRPLSASRARDGELVVRYRVRPVGDDPRPRQLPPARDSGLRQSRRTPVQRQRVAAYAIVVGGRGLLATQYSDRTSVGGRWGMPGGGIGAGEDPEVAVRREVLEETSQVVELGELRAVQTSHWIGRNPRGVIEDFHAVRLIYLADCPEPSDAVVLDVGGTTEAARWVPLTEWKQLPWTGNWRDILTEVMPRP